MLYSNMARLLMGPGLLRSQGYDAPGTGLSLR